MNHGRRFGMLTLLVLIGAATPAESQTRPTPLFGGGVMVSTENGRDDGPYLSGSLSGDAPAWDWQVGVNTSPPIAFVLEGSYAGAFTVEQSAKSSGGDNRYTRTHHDTMYSLTVHFRVSEPLSLVAGGSWVHIQTDEVRSLVTLGVPIRVEGPFTATHRVWSAGAVLGLDYTPYRWKLIRVGPMVRVFIFDHHDLSDSPPHFGYGSYVTRLGLRVQTRF